MECITPSDLMEHKANKSTDDIVALCIMPGVSVPGYLKQRMKAAANTAREGRRRHKLDTSKGYREENMKKLRTARRARQNHPDGFQPQLSQLTVGMGRTGVLGQMHL